MSDNNDGPLLRILKNKTKIIKIKKPPKDKTVNKTEFGKKEDMDVIMEKIPTLILDGSFYGIVDRG